MTRKPCGTSYTYGFFHPTATEYVRLQYGDWSPSEYLCRDINPIGDGCREPVLGRTVTAVHPDREAVVGVELQPYAAPGTDPQGRPSPTTEDACFSCTGDSREAPGLEERVADLELDVLRASQSARDAHSLASALSRAWDRVLNRLKVLEDQAEDSTRRSAERNR